MTAIHCLNDISKYQRMTALHGLCQSKPTNIILIWRQNVLKATICEKTISSFYPWRFILNTDNKSPYLCNFVLLLQPLWGAHSHKICNREDDFTGSILHSVITLIVVTLLVWVWKKSFMVYWSQDSLWCNTKIELFT